MDSYFYFVTVTKINFKVAPQQIIKKNKGQGFYIFYIEKLSVFTISVSIC